MRGRMDDLEQSTVHSGIRRLSVCQSLSYSVEVVGQPVHINLLDMNSILLTDFITVNLRIA